jgi:putative FmdB family regulatory protein
MPTYEYVCTDCGTPLEAVQSIHDPALTDCPHCAGRLRKVFGNVGVVFKGSGFYRTDSRGKKTASTSSGKADSGSSGSASAASSATKEAGTGSSSSSGESGSGGSGSTKKAASDSSTAGS